MPSNVDTTPVFCDDRGVLGGDVPPDRCRVSPRWGEPCTAGRWENIEATQLSQLSGETEDLIPVAAVAGVARRCPYCLTPAVIQILGRRRAQPGRES